MLTPNSTNILWLSDIHFKKEYGDEDHIAGKIFDKLATYLEKDLKDTKISYVIISGDIAFGGVSNQYESFEKKLKALDCLKEAGAVFLIIPGNHDVNWSYLKGSYDQEKKKNRSLTPKEFFSYDYKKNNNVENYHKIFLDFGTKYNCIENYNKSEAIGELEIKYDSDRLAGYVYDKNKNILFLLINSAYNSYGKVPRDSLIDGVDIKIQNSGYNKTIEDVLTDGETILNQFGNQTYNFEDFEKMPEIKEILDEKPFVLSVAHHPFDWLHWNERFSFDRSSPPINELIYKSHLHLVGHEHTQPTRGSYHGSGCLLLRSGMFLDSSVEIGSSVSKEELANFPNSFFSIIKLTDQTIEHCNYKYNFILLGENEREYQWEPYKVKFKYPRTIDISNLIKSHLGESQNDFEMPSIGQNHKVSVELKEVDSSSETFNYLSYLKEERGIHSFEEKEIVKNEASLAHRVFYSKDLNELRLLFFSLDNYHFTTPKMTIKPELISTIKSSIDSLKDSHLSGSIDQYSICFYDFYEYIPNLDELKEEGRNRARIVQSKFHKAQDYLFTSFKHYLFLKFTENNLLDLLHDANITYDLLNIGKTAKEYFGK